MRTWSVMMILAVALGLVPEDARAQSAQGPEKQRLRATHAERKAAAKRARARGLAVPAPGTARPKAKALRAAPGATRAGASSRAAAAADAPGPLAAFAPMAMADPASPPHYYGPFPNYANSPLPVLTPQVITAGNPLIARTYASDYATGPGVLAPVMVVLPVELPTGTLQAFLTFNQATPGASPTASAGQLFHAYLLRPAGDPGQYQVVYDTGELMVLPTLDPVGQVERIAVPDVLVQPGDRLAFYGQGIPIDIAVGGADALHYPSPAAPLLDGIITLGDPATFPLFPQARTYSFAAEVLDLSGANSVWAGGIRKFVDGLPGLGPAGANNLGQYIPVAVPDTTTYPGTDYYEIAVVQYREKMHSDVPATLLRGYVQLETTTNAGSSAHVALSTANLDGSSTPILSAGNPVFAVDGPHYLGPIVVAQKNRPVRILFRNLLPSGVAGNLFIPVDTTVMGSGMGPGMGGMEDPDPRNPMCGMSPKPMDCFTENRATLHLHGGISPWISDGTPHQWITPSDEMTPYPQGVSVKNVPDMPDPGPGAQTFFYTNQQSARLMFYHDHAWGITRLNVYAGEAAGYMITDPMEQSLVDQGILPAEQIPLVIQDKTFVPPVPQLEAQDPTWDLARWGGEGNLWVPHVYMPAQNPGDSSGVNQFGRWAYGPWFWPPTPVVHPPIPNPYFDPACDSDVQWCEPPEAPGVPYLSMGMEAFNDTPLVNGTAYPTVTLEPRSYRFRVLNAANDRFFNLQFYVADATGTEVALNAAEVAAALEDPAAVFPTPDTSLSPPGPSWIQVGTEGGFLPAPVVIPPQVITWVTDPTVFNAGNVDKHSLLLGPAERADVVVDLSQFAGRTLILYNDAPAAFPARDPRYDYYTGNADLTDTGGAPPTLPGYGPNTRTIMQIKVAAAPAAPPFDLARLQNAFLSTSQGGQGVFELSQNPIIVGQGAYNSAYGSTFRHSAPRDGLVRITDFSFSFNTLIGQGPGQTLTFPLRLKAIQDEMGEAFDRAYGRMSGNLGVETPGAQVGAQNFVLYPYINPASEILDGVELPMGSLTVDPISSNADGTQIWKITHNGVDTHPIHFHLYDVQVVNRVGWDGILRKVDPNELGWKDTVRISPLEDTIVALRPILPKQPFGLPDSIRPLNPMMPLGSTADFNNFDTNGDPIQPPLTNEIVNFGWEYVWHCHILSHEEMDMMRPVSVHASRLLPAAPLVAIADTTITWSDGTPANYLDPTTWGDPSAEVGYVVERAPVNGTIGAYEVLATPLANTTSFVDPTAVPGASYAYRVSAHNAAGSSTSVLPTLVGPPRSIPSAPTTVAVTVQAGPQVRLTFRDTARNGASELLFLVERAAGAGPFVAYTTLPQRANTGNVAYVDLAVQPGVTYTYRVAAVTVGGQSAFGTSGPAVVPAVPAAPSALTGTLTVPRTVRLTWTDGANNETGFTVQRSTDPTFTTGVVNANVAADVTAWQANLARRTTFHFRVRANHNLVGPSAFSNVFTITTQ